MTILMAPVAMLVGSNELKAHAAGNRPDSVKGPASMALYEDLDSVCHRIRSSTICAELRLLNNK